jgi:hypothetical protein
VAEGAALLEPVALRLALRVLSAHVLQTDSTHLAAGRRHQTVRQALQGLAGARGDRR